MSALAVVFGVLLVAAVTLDMVNTLVTTTTSLSRWWLSSLLYRKTWELLRTVAALLPSDAARERLLATYAPVSVLMLLGAWVTQQVIGFGLIWWGLDGVEGADSLFDSIYYSGVVYFTLGFGEVVPATTVPRIGALVEAMSGVLTTALVIGYLPALYSAYSDRERKLMMLDDGTEDRITPTNLLMSRAPTADVNDVLRYFEDWEDWVTGVLETHTSFPMLRLFRSKYPGQNWVTALGLLCDAALQCQMIVDARDRAPYWLVRRSVFLLDELTHGVDLSEYRARLDASYQQGSDQQGSNQEGSDQEGETLFDDLYETLAAHGFDLIDIEAARTETLQLRRLYDAQLEFLIDSLMCPRGFWGHRIGHRVTSMEGRAQALPEHADPSSGGSDLAPGPG